jgi:hypothetical protein
MQKVHATLTAGLFWFKVSLSMGEIPQEADSCLAGEEIPSILWNLKAHCRVFTSSYLEPD